MVPAVGEHDRGTVGRIVQEVAPIELPMGRWSGFDVVTDIDTTEEH